MPNSGLFSLTTVLILSCFPMFGLAEDMYWSGDDFTAMIHILSESGSTASFSTSEFYEGFTPGSIAYDTTDGTLWMTSEESDKIINLRWQDRFPLRSIHKDDFDPEAIEIEGATVDPRNGQLWVVDDTDDRSTLYLLGRDGTPFDKIDIGFCHSCQDITYDSSNDTLWSLNNGDAEDIVNFTLDGELLDRIPFSGSPRNLQGIFYDERDDTLWYSSRHAVCEEDPGAICGRDEGAIYHINKNGDELLSNFPLGFSATSITLTVPESGSGNMLGMSMLGLVFRRRRLL